MSPQHELNDAKEKKENAMAKENQDMKRTSVRLPESFLNWMNWERFKHGRTKHEIINTALRREHAKRQGMDAETPDIEPV